MNIVILGGGISGLLAGWVLREHRPLIIEAGPNVGGNYLAGGLKYIRATPAFRQLLGELALYYDSYQPQGAILADAAWGIGGWTHPHPTWLRSLSTIQREHIQRLHWMKTRGSSEGFRTDCMNDPLGEGDAMALAVNHGELIKALAFYCRLLLKRRVVAIEPDHILFESTDGDWTDALWRSGIRSPALPYDLLITTLPLGLTARLAKWTGLPDVKPNPLTIVNVQADGTLPWWRVAGEHHWNYLYTPFMKKVSRLSAGSLAGRFQAEAPGEVSIAEVAADLKHVFGGLDGLFSPSSFGERRVIPGHLRPLDRPLLWPGNWLSLGRFAEWNPRATAEKVLDRVIEWKQERGL